MINLDIGIEKANLKKINIILEALLADENVMYVKIKNFHWNIEGESFLEYHKFLDELADEAQENSDELAERMRMLGVKVNANMKNYLDKATIKEAFETDMVAKVMMEILLKDNEKSIKATREAIDKVAELGDAGTADFLTGIMETKEKRAWMLRSIVA